MGQVEASTLKEAMLAELQEVIFHCLQDMVTKQQAEIYVLTHIMLVQQVFQGTSHLAVEPHRQAAAES